MSLMDKYDAASPTLKALCGRETVLYESVHTLGVDGNRVIHYFTDRVGVTGNMQPNCPTCLLLLLEIDKE